MSTRRFTNRPLAAYMRMPSYQSWWQRLREERGSATAEYAITALAAAALAGVLIAIATSAEVRSLLMGIITKALNTA
ncbi:MAG: DUF4244 domain-containing protein [Bowdeniella nasicola]|nr:DUF4244 domain-containing protein [Bowdeniella nasicola]